MKKILAIAAFVFFIIGCDQIPGGKSAKTLPHAGNEGSAKNLTEVEKQPLALEPPFPLESRDRNKDIENKEQFVTDDKGKEISKVISEIEEILCEGDCSRYTPPFKKDLSEEPRGNP